MQTEFHLFKGNKYLPKQFFINLSILFQNNFYQSINLSDFLSIYQFDNFFINLSLFLSIYHFSKIRVSCVLFNKTNPTESEVVRCRGRGNHIGYEIFIVPVQQDVLCLEKRTLRRRKTTVPKPLEGFEGFEGLVTVRWTIGEFRSGERMSRGGVDPGGQWTSRGTK